jgi:hypothetical protein
MQRLLGLVQAPREDKATDRGFKEDTVQTGALREDTRTDRGAQGRYRHRQGRLGRIQAQTGAFKEDTATDRGIKGGYRYIQGRLRGFRHRQGHFGKRQAKPGVGAWCTDKRTFASVKYFVSGETQLALGLTEYRK